MTSPTLSSPLTVGDTIGLAFDDHRRLRIMAPEELLPLAAWLYTDAQPNLSVLDQLGATLRRCRTDELTLVGNGCMIDFVKDLVILESRYDRWPRKVLPQSVFWSVLNGLRSFLEATAGQPGLDRPEGYPLAPVRHFEDSAEDMRKPFCVSHTYFPVDWTADDVREAGQGAWTSPTVLRDETTGLWSGMWRELELAGYFDPSTGAVQTYFPVVAP